MPSNQGSQGGRKRSPSLGEPTHGSETTFECGERMDADEFKEFQVILAAYDRSIRRLHFLATVATSIILDTPYAERFKAL